jgi:hypothetical protein
VPLIVARSQASAVIEKRSGVEVPLFIIIAAAAGLAHPTALRLWSSVTPAAGVTIRPVPNFQIYAISTSGTPAIALPASEDGPLSRWGPFSLGAALIGIAAHRRGAPAA